MLVLTVFEHRICTWDDNCLSIQIIGVSTTAYQDRVEHEVIIKALIKHKLKKNLPVLGKKNCRYLI